jgi:hypothetical protein
MMLRRYQVLLLLGLSLVAAAPAQAAGNDRSTCLDAVTTLDAGGDVSDRTLAAAAQACKRLAQTPLDTDTSRKVTAAIATLADEQQKRAHH